jgi:integron integrase
VSGDVKVLDFGLAKLTEAGPSEHQSVELANSPTITSPTAMTRMGVILGTAACMAPEQARGKPVDKRADIWAFGVVLYEMLTGKRAFAADEVFDTLALVLTRDIDRSAVRADTPTPIRRLLGRCLVKDRAARLPDIGVARLEIDEALSAPAEAVTPVVTARRSRWPYVVASLTSLLLGGLVAGGAVWLATRSAPSKVARLAMVPRAGEPLSVEPNHPDLAVSADGKRLIYSSRVGDEHRFVVRALDRFETTVLDTLGTSPRGVFLSYDGAWVGFQAGGPAGVDARLFKVPVAGGSPIALCDLDGNLRGASWGPDDTIVFATGSLATGLFMLPSGRDTPVPLTKADPARGEADHRWPHVLPGGRLVLFEIDRQDPEPSDIGILSLQDRSWKVIVKGGTFSRYLPTGHLVYANQGTLRAIRFDPDRPETGPGPVPVLDGILTKDSGAANFGVTTAGLLVYMPGAHQIGTPTAQVVRVTRDARREPIDLEPGAYADPRLSPDGTRLLLTRVQAGGTRRDIWVHDLTRGTVTRLAASRSLMPCPVWMPDGRRVAFWSNEPDGGGMFQIAADGAGGPERLTRSTGSQCPDAWAPDGHVLVFSAPGPTTNLDVHMLDIAAKKATPLVQGPHYEHMAALSPDGRWLAYQSVESGRAQVYVRPFPNVTEARWQISSAGGERPFWGHDGRELFFWAGNSPVITPVENRVRLAIRSRHYSRRTEQAYVHWIRRYIVFHGKKHPSTMGATEIAKYLSWLATARRVSASTQNQAFSALVFLYKRVLQIDPGAIEHVPRARTPHRLPVVLSREEVGRLIGQMHGTMWLVAALLYGAGLRLQECLELRVKDIDFDEHQIVVRRGKGQKDRVTMMPAAVEDRLRAHLARVKRQHERDLAVGLGRVVLPHALDRKYPHASTEWGWQFVFPAARVCRDLRFGPPSRYHLHESVVQRAVAEAARKAGLTKRVGPHVFRHSFATHLLADGYDIRTLQELLGHADVATTMVYAHVLNRGGLGVRSPLDKLSLHSGCRG